VLDTACSTRIIPHIRCMNILRHRLPRGRCCDAKHEDSSL
jgi:hypothetical protein